MAAQTSAQSLLHLSSSSSSSSCPCFGTSKQSNLMKLRKTQVGFEPRGLIQHTKPIKVETLSLSYKSGIREVVEERKKRWEVKCTAEGIERGVLMGRRGREEAVATAKVLVPERFKVVALMACVMCLCNADRVVMSVAVVPLATKFGWSNSFLGIVQVIY